MNVKLFVQRAAITALATLTFSSDLAAQVSPPPPATAAENTTNAAIPILPERVKPYPKIVLPERAMTNALNEADRIKREMPVTDNLGRIYYTVMLNDNATDGALPEFPSGTENRFGSWHKPSMLRLNAVLEKAYGFTATSVTSWLLNSFSAYLTQTQVVALRKDARVQLIEENHPVQPSALWVDGRVSGSDSPQVPWGVLALGGPRYSNATTRVWVLDAGVGLHSYLPGVFFRTNIISSSLPVVGCYSHATMVAGVVGAYATGSNSNGILGFNSQVPTGSISYLNALGSSNCATGSFNSPSDIVNALDYIRSVPATKVPVVNMSFGSQNPNSGIGVDATFRLAVQRVTQPATNFPGAFVVEAAGNRADDACAYIYVPPSGQAEIAMASWSSVALMQMVSQLSG